MEQTEEILEGVLKARQWVLVRNLGLTYIAENLAKPLRETPHGRQLMDEAREWARERFSGPDSEEGDTIPGQFASLNPEEGAIWRVVLPRTYTESSFSLYAHIPPPLRTLELLADCRRKNLFDAYEIWTMEGPDKDPLLVGKRIRDGRTYAWIIDAWTGEGDTIISFPAAKAMVRRWLRNRMLRRLGIYVGVLISFSMLIVGTTGNVAAASGVFSALVTGVLILVGISFGRAYNRLLGKAKTALAVLDTSE